MTTPVNLSGSASNNSLSFDNDYACGHNGRPETTIRDVFEHLGNIEFGSSIAEARDIATGDTTRGDSSNAPDKSSESISPDKKV